MKQSIQRMCFAYVYIKPRLKFSKRRSNISGSRSWYQMKGLARGNTLVKYESSTTYQSKVMTKVKVFEKSQTPRSEGRGHVIKLKVLPEGVHMWNMKALPPTHQKLWSRLKFLKKRSNSKVKRQRDKVISNERSCRKEYTCEIWKSYLLPIKSYDQG
jgi:hypothetical protein